MIDIQRQLQCASHGALWLNQRLEVSGTYQDSFVTGPITLVEHIQVEQGNLWIGNFCFHRSVVFLLPPFSITRIRYEDSISKTQAILFHSPDCPRQEAPAIVLDDPAALPPSNPDELMEIFSAAKQAMHLELPVSRLSLRAKKILDRDYKERVSIQRTSATLGVSHSHLARQFKKDYGIAPVEYCHRLRMAEATWMLSSGENIAEVSMAVGYEDLGRFYKQHRKIMSHSPGFCKENSSQQSEMNLPDRQIKKRPRVHA